MNGDHQPCADCPWISRAERDIKAITDEVKAAAANGQWFCCHVNMGTCWGAVKFGAASEMRTTNRKDNNGEQSNVGRSIKSRGAEDRT